MKHTVRTFIKDQIFIISGVFLIAVALNVFLVPNKINCGGVSGVASILFYLFNIRLSLTNVLINGIMFIIAKRYLSNNDIIKTLCGIFYLSFFLELTRLLPVYRGSIIVIGFLGGLFIGLGMGIVLRLGYSTGGSDFVALIMKKKSVYLSATVIIMLVDGLIVVASGIIFKSVDVTVFSLLTLFVASRVADYIMVKGDRAKVINIISTKSDMVSDAVINQHRRGLTGIYSKGMYSHSNFMLLYCVVSPRELPGIVKTVRGIDPESFVVISDAKEVFGQGFKSE